MQDTDEVECVSIASSSSFLNFCIGSPRNCLPNHAPEIMVYGVKHGYRDIASLAAPMSLDHPLGTMVVALPANIIIPWVHSFG